MNLSYENCQVLNLVQAMLGSISENFRFVFIDSSDSFVRIKFILDKKNEEDVEEIEDIVFEFEALQDKSIDVDYEVIFDSRPLSEIGFSGRMVYSRRE